MVQRNRAMSTRLIKEIKKIKEIKEIKEIKAGCRRDRPFEMVQEIDLWPHRIKSKKSSLLAQQASADNAANRPVRASLRYLVPLRGRPARCWGGRLETSSHNLSGSR